MLKASSKTSSKASKVKLKASSKTSSKASKVKLVVTLAVKLLARSLSGEMLQAYVSIRQHTSAYVSIRQHTSAYVSIRQHTSACLARCPKRTSAYVSIRQHTSAYVSIRQAVWRDAPSHLPPHAHRDLVALIEALKGNRSTRRLDMDGCGIGDAGCALVRDLLVC
jgi:hypothetical protein